MQAKKLGRNSLENSIQLINYNLVKPNVSAELLPFKITKIAYFELMKVWSVFQSESNVYVCILIAIILSQLYGCLMCIIVFLK